MFFNHHLLLLPTVLAGQGVMLTPSEKEHIQKKKEMGIKMSNLLRQLAWQIIFLLLIIFVCDGNQDNNVYWQNQDLRNTFLQNTGFVSTDNVYWQNQDLCNTFLLNPGFVCMPNYNQV